MVAMAVHDRTIGEIEAAEAERILRLRLVVARAAQPDSMNWWDDRSLTAEGLYLADRLFARRPRQAAAKIALQTARVRYVAAVPETGVVHLFDLGDRVEYELARVSVAEAWLPATALESPEALLLAIGDIVPDGVGYLTEYAGQRRLLAGPFEIRLSPEADPSIKPPVARACALALACAESGLGRPVFPYMKVKQ